MDISFEPILDEPALPYSELVNWIRIHPIIMHFDNILICRFENYRRFTIEVLPFISSHYLTRILNIEFVFSSDHFPSTEPTILLPGEVIIILDSGYTRAGSQRL